MTPKRKRTSTKILATATLAVAGSGLAASTPVEAQTSGWSLPFFDGDYVIPTYSTNWLSGHCHNACGTGNWFANDLYDPVTYDGLRAPILAMRSGSVRFSGYAAGCGEDVRYATGTGSGKDHWLNCHGQAGSRTVSVGDWVTPGQMLMKIGNTQTGSIHLHLEHRYLQGTNWGASYIGYCVGAEISKVLHHQSVLYVTAYNSMTGVTSNSSCTY